MICLHDSSESLARTRMLLFTFFPVVKGCRFFNSSYIFHVYSVESDVWFWLQIVIIIKLINLKSLILLFKSEISVTYSGDRALPITDRLQNPEAFAWCDILVTAYYRRTIVSQLYFAIKFWKMFAFNCTCCFCMAYFCRDDPEVDQ